MEGKANRLCHAHFRREPPRPSHNRDSWEIYCNSWRIKNASLSKAPKAVGWYFLQEVVQILYRACNEAVQRQPTINSQLNQVLGVTVLT